MGDRYGPVTPVVGPMAAMGHGSCSWRSHIEDKFQFFAFFVGFGEVDYIVKIMKFIAFNVKEIKGAGVPGFFTNIKQYPFAVKFITRLEDGAI